MAQLSGLSINPRDEQLARRLRLLLAAIIIGAAPPLAAAATGTAPKLEITLTPHIDRDRIDALGVTMRVEAPKLKSGEAILQIMRVTEPFPIPRYDGDAIVAHDDRGALPLTIQDSIGGGEGRRKWIVSRPTLGDVYFRFTAVPRQVSATTRPAPLYDLRAEAGGLNGAGIGFLPTPASLKTVDIRLKWDLPRGSQKWRGVWSFGEGAVRKVGDVDLLTNSYYMVGPVESYPQRLSRLNMYWLAQPPFKPDEVVGLLQRLYDFESRFFNDTSGDYRIFVRAQPYPGGGGTAVKRSFMFGWGPGSHPTVSDMSALFAHEMVHNWMRIDGENSLWYIEGGAEYYAAVLASRSGLVAPEKALAELNRNAKGYYTNPLQKLSLSEVAKITWSDRRARPVPYDRGAIFLARTESLLRTASGGKRGVDDVVREIKRRQDAGERAGVEQWIEIVGRDLGAARARSEVDAMIAGNRLELIPGPFTRCIHIEPHLYRVVDYGVDPVSLEAGRPVSGVVEGSGAALAGLRNGDGVKSVTGLGDTPDPEGLVSLRVVRDGAPMEISFKAKIDVVNGFAWALTPGIPVERCRL